MADYFIDETPSNLQRESLAEANNYAYLKEIQNLSSKQLPVLKFDRKLSKDLESVCYKAEDSQRGASLSRNLHYKNVEPGITYDSDTERPSLIPDPPHVRSFKVSFTSSYIDLVKAFPRQAQHV